MYPSRLTLANLPIRIAASTAAAAATSIMLSNAIASSTGDCAFLPFVL